MRSQGVNASAFKKTKLICNATEVQVQETYYEIPLKIAKNQQNKTFNCYIIF